MTSSAKNKQRNPAEVSHGDMDELKRNMRSAYLTAWAHENQQRIIAAVAALLLVIVGISLWREHIATQRTSAATLYYQALNTADTDTEHALLSKVVRDYGHTAYAGFAQLLLAEVDQAYAIQHLTALLAKGAPDREIRWQARLDLARAYLRKGDKVKARKILAKSTGENYEQLRHYLMAEAADNDTDRASRLEQALNDISHDTVLKKRIEKRLAVLKTSSGPEALRQ